MSLVQFFCLFSSYFRPLTPGSIKLPFFISPACLRRSLPPPLRSNIPSGIAVCFLVIVEAFMRQLFPQHMSCWRYWPPRISLLFGYVTWAFSFTWKISIIARSKEFIVIISGSGIHRNLCTVLNNNRCVFLRYFALKLSRLWSIERFQFKLQVSCCTFSINCCPRFLSFYTSCHFMNSFSGVGVWLRRWMEIQSHVSLLTHGAPVSTRG